MITKEQRERLLAVINRQPTNPPSPRLSMADIDELRVLQVSGREADAWAELSAKANAANGRAFEAMMKASAEAGREMERQRRQRLEHDKRMAATGIQKVSNTTPVQHKPVAIITNHKIRTNSLDMPIQKAINLAGSIATAAVFVQLRTLAISEEVPFTGQIGEGALCYTDDNNKPATLTKAGLGKRLKKHHL